MEHMDYKELANYIWEQHVDVFQHFDLVCGNGNSLEDETKSNSLFNALVTLKTMLTQPIIRTTEKECYKQSNILKEVNIGTDILN